MTRPGSLKNYFVECDDLKECSTGYLAVEPVSVEKSNFIKWKKGFLHSIMGLDSHSALLMVRPIHLGLRTSCPSRLMAAVVCLTAVAWLPYPRKHGFSIN